MSYVVQKNKLMKLKIYILVDNAASSTCKAEHGLSYVVDFDSRVLFDTGQSDLFLSNAAIMQVDLQAIETVALSHGHYDHGNGLKYLNGKTLVCHPDVFLNRFSGKQLKYAGINIDKQKVIKNFDLRMSKEPYWLSDKMLFLGEIPRKFGFEKSETHFYLKSGESDLLLDDSAIVVKMNQGLFVISGCSHSGICNIIEYAKEVTNEDRVFGVIGGFHLKHNNRQTKETVKYFKQNNIQIVMPSHCTELPALSVFYNEFGGEQVKAGNLYTFEEV